MGVQTLPSSPQKKTRILDTSSSVTRETLVLCVSDVLHSIPLQAKIPDGENKERNANGFGCRFSFVACAMPSASCKEGLGIIIVFP